MNRKKYISKLLALTMIFNASMKTRAVQLNEKENTDICQSVDENQNLDEKYIAKKCVEINNEMIKITVALKNYYNSLHRIKLQIDGLFEEITKFHKSDNVFFLNKEYVDLYNSLPEKDKEKINIKFSKIRKKLLETIKNETKILLQNRNQAQDIIKKFSKIFYLSKNNNLIWNKLRGILESAEGMIDDNEEMYTEIFNYSFAEIFNFSEKWECFLKNEFNDDFNCIINYKEYFENFFYGALHFDDLENGLYRLNKNLEKILKDNTNKE